MVRGIDISPTFQPLPFPTPDDCAALLAAGRTFALVGLQNNDIPTARQQIIAFRNAGIAVPGVILENCDPAYALGAITDLRVDPWYAIVAAERDSGFTTEDATDRALNEAQQRGLVRVIYTSAEAVNELGLSTVTKWAADGVLLFNAYYFLDGDRDEFAPVDFCGWTQAWMQQTSGGTVAIPGVATPLDHDYTEATFPMPTVLPPAQPQPPAGEDDGSMHPLSQGQVIQFINVVNGGVLTRIPQQAFQESDASPAGVRRFIVDIPLTDPDLAQIPGS